MWLNWKHTIQKSKMNTFDCGVLLKCTDRRQVTSVYRFDKFIVAVLHPVINSVRWSKSTTWCVSLHVSNASGQVNNVSVFHIEKNGRRLQTSLKKRAQTMKKDFRLSAILLLANWLYRNRLSVNACMCVHACACPCVQCSCWRQLFTCLEIKGESSECVAVPGAFTASSETRVSYWPAPVFVCTRVHVCVCVKSARGKARVNNK